MYDLEEKKFKALIKGFELKIWQEKILFLALSFSFIKEKEIKEELKYGR